jgi:hypothetical protein
MRTMIVLAVCLALGACKKKSSDDTVAKLEGFSKAMCECKDKACADKVNQDMTTWGTEMAKNAGNKDAKPDPDVAKKSADAMTKYAECMTKAMMAGAGSAVGSGSGQTVGSGSDVGSGNAGTGSGSGGETMTKGGGNCPSMVLHAETKADVKGKDVVLTISSTDKDAVIAIQKRTDELLKDKANKPAGAVHDQKGSQGGKQGKCPVHWDEGGKATSKKEANGVTITITPKDKPEALKTTIDERIKAAAEWVKANIKEGDDKNKGGVGGGKGEHGSTHAGSGDGKGKERKGSGSGSGDGKGGGAGTGGGGGAGTGGGSGKGDKKPADKAGGGW